MKRRKEGVVEMARNVWSKILELLKEDRLSAKKELGLKRRTLRSFPVTGGKVEYVRKKWR